MMYASLLISLCFGLYHECYGNWISNDILAFASIHVVCSRIQAVSYQTAVIFVVGMSIFDIFFFYVVDLLSKIQKEIQSNSLISRYCNEGKSSTFNDPRTTRYERKQAESCSSRHHGPRYLSERRSQVQLDVRF